MHRDFLGGATPIGMRLLPLLFAQGFGFGVQLAKTEGTYSQENHSCPFALGAAKHENGPCMARSP